MVSLVGNRATKIPDVSIKIGNFEFSGGLLINVHDPVKFSPLEDIIPHFCENLPNFVTYQPSSGKVFPLEDLDENRGQFDFILPIVFPFREIFLVRIVIPRGIFLGLLLRYFSAIMIINHFLLVEICDIFVIRLCKAVCFV